MFQLYKKRDFSELVGDTFLFFKAEGKNYFKNYFILNGGLLLLLVVLLYFLLNFFFEGVFASRNGNGSDFLDNFLYDNIWIFVGAGLVLLVFLILISFINYTFPVTYLELISAKKEVSNANLLKTFRSKIIKAITFFFASLFIIIPIIAIVSAIMLVLVMFIIGIPLLIIVIPAIASWIALSYYHYLSNNKGYFTALNDAFETIKQNFWKIIGSSIVVYAIVYIVVSFISIIPYLLFFANVYINPEGVSDKSNDEAISFATILATILLGVSIIINYTLQNIILVNQGIIYYSAKEETENIHRNSEIDLIGKNED